MALSEARIRANRKYDDKAYDKFNVRLPKGSRQLIEEAGETYNGLINKAFKEYCENHNLKLKDQAKNLVFIFALLGYLFSLVLQFLKPTLKTSV